MSQKVADGDDLGAMFEEVRGECVPQAMATRRGLRPWRSVPSSFESLSPRGDAGRVCGSKRRSPAPARLDAAGTVLDTRHGIGRQVHAPIFAPFALHDMHSLLLPIDLLSLSWAA